MLAEGKYSDTVKNKKKYGQIANIQAQYKKITRN
jgi:hypothetical protein